jgi:ABC-2 type transport system ATP-binding protein
MAEHVIVTNGLVRRFGANTAVDDLSISIEAGDVFGFLGHNGAGKTTTVRLLNGVLAPDSGSIRVLGMDPATHGPQLRARTGVLTETPALDDRLTARITLRLFADIYGVPEAQVNRRVDELLAMFDLSERGDDKIGGFSKGMRQRMALARTLIHSPDIIFLDEPTAALDPVATREVHELIRDASSREGRTVFLCTHNLYEAERLCTRVAVLAHGRLLAIGTPSELAQRYGRQQRLAIEVAPGQVGRAQQVIAGLPWGAIATVENAASGRVQVQGIPRTEVPDAVNALVAQGIGIYEVTREEARLEDVYFALQAQVDAAAGEEPVVAVQIEPHREVIA